MDNSGSVSEESMPPKNEDADGLTEARLTYAWEWYKLHANQRATFLRFFLISTGVLLSGYITAFDNNIYYASFIAASLGVIQSIVFVIFDERNLHFVRRAIGVLEKIEENLLFPNDYVGPNESVVGLLRRDTGTRRKDRARTFRGEGPAWKIKIWVRTLQCLIGFMFLVLMIPSFTHMVWVNKISLLHLLVFITYLLIA